VPTLDDVLTAHTDLGSADVEWLHMLVADWQVVADLSFADLVLWLPDRDGTGYWCGAQMRPTTGPTAFIDDLVGAFVPRGRRPLIDAAYGEGRIAREGDPEWRDDVPVRVEAIPVRRGTVPIGVIARNTNLLGVRTPSRLELAYLQTATDLTRMISAGRFPVPGVRRDWSASPRVGDGFVRTGPSGVVEYASPNAQSAYRRLGFTGDLIGQTFGELTSALAATNGPVEEALAVTLSGTEPREAELGNADATVVVRLIPLQPAAQQVGTLVLLRDVTELRSRERQLLSKDATIREIHHRVKNNLQTVAALLRLQARRTRDDEARLALEEAVRRIGSIAVVHETLSQTFDDFVPFDDVADRLAAMVSDVATGVGTVETVRDGSFGELPGQVAASLATVLTELLQNAGEHGFDAGSMSGTVVMRVLRAAGRLSVTVDDDGVGLPADFDPVVSGGLGLSIVRTIVESELDGLFTLTGNPAGGTRANLDVPVTAVDDARPGR
jgi:two-component system, sensor histidine kinase PdtaS